MTGSVPFPQVEPVSLQFSLGLSVGDLARIGLPALAGYAAVGPAGLALGGAGLAVAKQPVRGEKLDRHIVNAAKHVAGVNLGAWYAVDEVIDDVVVLDNDTVFGLVEVGSVDIDMLSDAEAAANLAAVNDYLKAIDYPVTFLSQQRTTPLDDYAGEETADVTDHFIVVPVWSDSDVSPREVATVQSRVSDAVQELTAADMAADRVTADRFDDAVVPLMRKPDDVGVTGYEQSDVCRRVLQVTSVPSEVKTGWLADLLDVDVNGQVSVVQRVAPVGDDDRSWLRQQYNKAVTEQAAASDPRRSQEMSRVAGDIEELLDAEITGEPLVNYAVYIVVSGGTWSVVDSVEDVVRAELRKHRIDVRVPWFRMNRLARTVTGLPPEIGGAGFVVSGTAAAAGFPWAAYDTVETGGVVFGRDQRSENPVVLNRFSWEAGHVVRMGKIGSGKSFAAKLELVRCLQRYDDLHVVVVDPKQEYGFRETLPDEWWRRVQRYSVQDRTADNTDELVDYVRTAYQLGHDHDGKTLVVIDEAHRLLNDDTGRQVLGELVREGRDQAIAVTAVTQNAADFTQSREGRNILKNIDCYVLMRHQDVAAGVEEFFRLSDAEATRLRKLRTGTDVDFSEAVVRGPVNTVLRIRAADRELRFIGEADGGGK